MMFQLIAEMTRKTSPQKTLMSAQSSAISRFLFDSKYQDCVVARPKLVPVPFLVCSTGSIQEPANSKIQVEISRVQNLFSLSPV